MTTTELELLRRAVDALEGISRCFGLLLFGKLLYRIFSSPPPKCLFKNREGK